MGSRGLTRRRIDEIYDICTSLRGSSALYLVRGAGGHAGAVKRADRDGGPGGSHADRHRKATGAGERRYEEATEAGGSAADCIECRQCEDACPQHLPITDHLKKAAEMFA